MVIIEYKSASSTDLTNTRQSNVSTFTPVKINLGSKSLLSSPKAVEKSESISSESPLTDSKTRSRTASISSVSSRSRSNSSNKTSRSSSRTSTTQENLSKSTNDSNDSVNKSTVSNTGDTKLSTEVTKPPQSQNPQMYPSQIQAPIFPGQQQQFFNQPPGIIPQQQQQGFYNAHAITQQDQNYRFLLFHRNWRTFMRRFFGFIDI